jgi:hypothetical protein
MDFMQRLQETINEGLDTSRKVLQQARDRTLDLGDKGVLKFEILQLENQAEKLMSKLGTTVYKTFTEDENATINKNTPEVEQIINEITRIRERISEKEKLLKNIDKKS